MVRRTQIVAELRHPRRDSRRISVLTIAGSDSGGASGAQADLRAIRDFGLHGLSAITAVTAQNTAQVRAIQRVPAAVLAAQLDAVAGDFRIGAVKIGMLGSAAAIGVVAGFLDRCHCPVVLDPVLVASSGALLLPRRALAQLRAELIPRVDLLTPNLPEAAALLGRHLHDDEDGGEIARELLVLGAKAVLLKGGHSADDPVRDYLADAQSLRVFRHRRLPLHARGTGCTLASAIAAGLAQDHDIVFATRAAQRYLQRALRGAYRAGRGHCHILGRA